MNCVCRSCIWNAKLAIAEREQGDAAAVGRVFLAGEANFCSSNKFGRHFEGAPDGGGAMVMNSVLPEQWDELNCRRMFFLPFFGCMSASLLTCIYNTAFKPLAHMFGYSFLLVFAPENESQWCFSLMDCVWNYTFLELDECSYISVSFRVSQMKVPGSRFIFEIFSGYFENSLWNFQQLHSRCFLIDLYFIAIRISLNSHMNIKVRKPHRNATYAKNTHQMNRVSDHPIYFSSCEHYGAYWQVRITYPHRDYPAGKVYWKYVVYFSSS